MSNLFNSSNSFDNLRDDTTNFIDHVSDSAQNAWAKSSSRERGSLFAALTVALGSFLILMIWRSSRPAKGHYIELPSHDNPRY